MLPIFKKVKPVSFLKNLYFTQKEPVSLVHFVTNRCNARCSFCFIDFDKENIFSNELSIDEIEKITKTLQSGLHLKLENLWGVHICIRKTPIVLAWVLLLS